MVTNSVIELQWGQPFWPGWSGPPYFLSQKHCGPELYGLSHISLTSCKIVIIPQFLPDKSSCLKKRCGLSCLPVSGNFTVRMMWALTFMAAELPRVVSMCLQTQTLAVASKLSGVPTNRRDWGCGPNLDTEQTPAALKPLRRAPNRDSMWMHTRCWYAYHTKVVETCLAWKVTVVVLCLTGVEKFLYKMTNSKSWENSFIIKIIFYPTCRKAEGYCKREILLSGLTY